jgi:hypothetical protein
VSPQIIIEVSQKTKTNMEVAREENGSRKVATEMVGEQMRAFRTTVDLAEVHLVAISYCDIRIKHLDPISSAFHVFEIGRQDNIYIAV